MRINWTWFCENLMNELKALPEEDRSLTLSISELLKRTGAAGAEPKGFRQRGFWANAVKGKGSWGAAQHAGLSISLIPNEPGVEIQEVAFRLKKPELYRIVGIRPDDSLRVLGEGLTKDEATDLFVTLIDVKDYSGLRVEREQP